jgi:hypothetical protein
MEPEEPFGFFDNDGNKINPEPIPKPNLCESCKKDGDPEEELFCLLNRAGQDGEGEFRCDAYEKKLF